MTSSIMCFVIRAVSTDELLSVDESVELLTKRLATLVITSSDCTGLLFHVTLQYVMLAIRDTVIIVLT